jgi:hypothetical protein
MVDTSNDIFGVFEIYLASLIHIRAMYV